MQRHGEHRQRAIVHQAQLCAFILPPRRGQRRGSLSLLKVGESTHSNTLCAQGDHHDCRRNHGLSWHDYGRRYATVCTVRQS